MADIFTREEVNAIERDAFSAGFIAGMRQFAYWKDGVEYVGTCGTTIRDAILRMHELPDYRANCPVRDGER